MIRVTVFNEYFHELNEEKIREIYPRGIHKAIAGFLESDEVTVKTVTLFSDAETYDPEAGLTEELLENTDVLIWWGHLRHGFVSDEAVARVVRHIHCGMGAIFLHSAHHSKPFKALMGTTCNLHWREDSKERLYNINPAHPIMAGIGDYFDLPNEEMYGERFEIPEPEELLMIGTYPSHEVMRSACTFKRVNGRIFYLQPGHEAYPTFFNENIQLIIKNAVRWACPTYRARALNCPMTEEIAF